MVTKVYLEKVKPPKTTNGDKIYLIYVFGVIRDSKNIIKIKHERCWGYFFSLEEAQYVIENNVTDIFENGSYNYAKIVIQNPGLAMFSSPRETNEKHWFQADYFGNGDVPLESPEISPCEIPIDKSHLIGLG